MPSHVVDMIEELKLRRWARLNHRRLTDRDDSLHPIILEELGTILAENEVAESNHSTVAVSIADAESITDGFAPPASTERRLDEDQGSLPAPYPEAGFRNTEYYVHS